MVKYRSLGPGRPPTCNALSTTVILVRGGSEISNAGPLTFLPSREHRIILLVVFPCVFEQLVYPTLLESALVVVEHISPATCHRKARYPYLQATTVLFKQGCTFIVVGGTGSAKIFCSIMSVGKTRCLRGTLNILSLYHFRKQVSYRLDQVSRSWPCTLPRRPSYSLLGLVALFSERLRHPERSGVIAGISERKDRLELY